MLPLQESKGVFKALFAHAAKYFGCGREEDSCETIHVLFGQFYTCVCYINLLMKIICY